MQSISAAGLDGHWVDVITWIFVLANTGRLLAYLPQFVSAWNCPHGAKSVSILTWSYFTFAHCTALMYALHVLHDSKSVWIFAGNLGVTLCLVSLLLWKRLTFIRAVRRSFDEADTEAADVVKIVHFVRNVAASNDDCFDLSMANN
ncbi:MAG TPA: hypothetical protein PKH72_04135 [Rhodoferax sp.]|jgi:uncharacterized protein with PQ loop repeat|nr:hypothetical protein [Rhodoferax sp.]HNV58818.1 hypothetical protein [Rhodoferax sp.]HPW29828.1 hypothetical protein [Rhodoferax sp.]